jgi:hypothetical protein
MFLILPALCSLVNPVRAQVRDVSVVIAADTHFDMPPESDQFYHVKAMNRLPDRRLLQAIHSNSSTVW